MIRFNPLIQSHVITKPNPYTCKQEEIQPQEINKQEYVDQCYLCPRNKRAGSGLINPDYTNTYIFQNDFAAVKMDQPEYSNDKTVGKSKTQVEVLSERLLKTKGVRGICKVVCFSPKHNLTMAEMDPMDIIKVIEAWTVEYKNLGSDPVIQYVQIFENKGAVMGCSNPHPHGQIWATEDIPDEPSKELYSLQKYYSENDSCLLCDYVSLEVKNGSRIVCDNEDFIALVPFWAAWPFEMLVLSKGHLASLVDIAKENKTSALADILSQVTIRYDNLYSASFPYSMGIHQAPCDGKNHSHDTHFHIHFYPPLQSGVETKKMDMLACPEREWSAEESASRLASTPLIHYKKLLEG